MPGLKDRFSAIELWILNGYAWRIPKNYNEESVGFEPTELLHPFVFKTNAINLSANYPVASLGFEPRTSVSETDVLPLDYKALLHFCTFTFSANHICTADRAGFEPAVPSRERLFSKEMR